MNVVELVGRFHPLFVHLPIGILLLGVFFEWLSLHPKFKNLQPSIPIILLIGAAAALFSCVTGYLLSQSGEYDTSAVSWHQWMGVALMVISFGYWWAHQKAISLLFRKTISVFVFILINITGHLGGSLTHGEDYLTESISAKETTTDFSKINLAEAKLYEDLVKPILSQRCYTCHSTAKQKGKLRLDDKESLLKGGKHGVVLVANKVDESEIILRLLLPLDEKDHMPPKEKSQLTSTEIEILKLWIVNGADFEKTVTKLGQVEEFQSIVKIQVTSTPEVPVETVAEANKETIQQLKRLEVTVLPVAQNSNYLCVNLINTHNLDSALLILKDLKKQIVWLKAGNTSIKDDNLKSLSELTQLTKLTLDNSAFTGEGLLFLKSLSHLQSLNLANTQVTVNSLKPLMALKDLRILYLYQTQVKLSDLEFLQKSLPQVKIEIGGYQVPALPTDTLKVKAAIN